jgi:ribosome biogenesis protein BRX1
MAKKRAGKPRILKGEDNEKKAEVEQPSKLEIQDQVEEHSVEPDATATTTATTTTVDDPNPETSAAPAVADEGPVTVSDGKYRNKQRCLTLCSRGVTARYRHFLEDLRCLLPHHKKESKLDPGADGVARAVNDIAEVKSCNTFLFLECRKHQDAYLWMGKVGNPSGPSVRFHVTNLHTMDELRLTGNCMKGSRPILTFDESFDRVPHLKVSLPTFARLDFVGYWENSPMYLF